MRAGWALLRRRDFGLLWAGGLISETGDWFLLVGLPVWVLQVTGSSLVTATVFLVGLLPSLVVGPLAGVLVDRWDRRRTLVAVSLAQAGFLLPLLAVDGRGDLWVVYVVMAVEAVLAQFNDPARNALVPALVGRDDLVGANALIGLNGNLARLVGSPLGGVLVEVAGLPGLVVGDAASFLLGAVLIGLVRPRPPVAASQAGSGSGSEVGSARSEVGSARSESAGSGSGAGSGSEVGSGSGSTGPPVPGRAPTQPTADAAPAPGRAPTRPAADGLPSLGRAPTRPAAGGLPSLGRAPTRPAVGGAPSGRVAEDRNRGVRLSTAPGTVRAVAGEWVDGLRVVMGDRGLRWGLAVNGLAAVAQGIFTVLFVVFVARELGGDGGQVGLLRGVQAIGGLIGGALVVGLARRLEAGRLLGISLLAFALVDLAIWNGPLVTTADWLYLGLFVAAGIPGVGVLTGLTALVQERTADAYLGRVFATFLGSFNGLTAVGMLLAGLLGDAVGVLAVLNGQAGLYLLAGLAAVATLGRRARPDAYPRTSKRVRMPLA
jgi:MFS family permease